MLRRTAPASFRSTSVLRVWIEHGGDEVFGGNRSIAHRETTSGYVASLEQQLQQLTKRLAQRDAEARQRQRDARISVRHVANENKLLRSQLELAHDKLKRLQPLRAAHDADARADPSLPVPLGKSAFKRQRESRRHQFDGPHRSSVGAEVKPAAHVAEHDALKNKPLTLTQKFWIGGMYLLSCVAAIVGVCGFIGIGIGFAAIALTPFFIFVCVVMAAYDWARSLLGYGCGTNEVENEAVAAAPAEEQQQNNAEQVTDSFAFRAGRALRDAVFPRFLALLKALPALAAAAHLVFLLVTAALSAIGSTIVPTAMLF